MLKKLLKPTRRRLLLNAGLLAAGWELSCVDIVSTQELVPTPDHSSDRGALFQTKIAGTQ
jgi:hypothetical protein